MRLVVDVTKYVDGTYLTELQFNNDIAMSAVGGDLTYSATINAYGVETVFSNLTHYQYQQWHREFFSAGRPAVNVQHDPAYLIQSKAILPYNVGNGVNESNLISYGDFVNTNDVYAPFAINSVTQYMPMTGGRGDIGPQTSFATAWIFTQDARAKAFVLAQAETAASIPWHTYDAANKRWLNTDDYPNLWTDGRGGIGTPGDANAGGLSQPMGGANGWSWDTSHQPNLSFIPYIMTGSRYHMDQLNAVASADIMGFWSAPRKSWDVPVNGRTLNAIVVHDQNQMRGGAWSLRQIQQAAFYGVDGTFEKNYFTRVMDDNYFYMMAQTPRLQSQQGEFYGIFEAVYGIPAYIPPWQQDFLMTSIFVAANFGHTDALAYLRWTMNWHLGRFMPHAGYNERDGAAYIFPIFDNSGNRLTTWEQAGKMLADNNTGNGIGTWNSTSGGYFGQLGLMSMSLIYKLTRDVTALNLYNWLLANDVPYSQPGNFQADPTFHITPLQ